MDKLFVSHVETLEQLADFYVERLVDDPRQTPGPAVQLVVLRPVLGRPAWATEARDDDLPF